MFKTEQEALAFVAENKIRLIDFKIADLWGRWRHLTIPSTRLNEELLREGVGFDGSNYGFTKVEKSDMVFIPDVSSSFLEKRADSLILSMIGNIISVDGETEHRFEQDPRYICSKAEQYLKETGIADEILLSPEFEFYVFDEVKYGYSQMRGYFEIDSCQTAVEPSETQTGYEVREEKGYHIAPPNDTLFDFRNELVLSLEEAGIPVKYHHHEIGSNGQLEIEVEFDKMTKMADSAMLLKYMVKNLAIEYGKTATFMPKPLFQGAGSGMHVHFKLFKDSLPLFCDKGGYSSLSQTALYFIGGLLKHSPSLMALTNPSTNSYKRLVPGYEAPVSIVFATSNRSAAIRIPGYAKNSADKRIEFRPSDSTCNPYLAFSALLMAGIDGILKKINPVDEGFGPYDVNLYNLTKDEQKKIKKLPASLEEALDSFEQDNEFLLTDQVFPRQLINNWLSEKRKEARQITARPHPYEYYLYYDF